MTKPGIKMSAKCFSTDVKATIFANFPSSVCFSEHQYVSIEHKICMDFDSGNGNGEYCAHGGVSYCVLRCELTTSVDFPYFSCCKMDPRQTHDSDSHRKQPRKRYSVQFLQQINAAKVRLVM